MKAGLSLGTLLAAIAVTALGCATHNLPPAQQLLEPGPGVGGPGPGVLPPATPPLPLAAAPAAPPTVQVLFSRPEGLQIRWDVSGFGQFESEPLIAPGRYNFPQGGIYRLKLTNIGGREGVELYPTMELGPVTPRTGAFLAHNAVPVEFAEEDFDQVLAGNFVTKVIYLPDLEFQGQAVVGVGTLVSTRLDPGLDPIVEADRRGAIMAIVRLGNKDVEMPGVTGDMVGVSPASFAAGACLPGASCPGGNYLTGTGGAACGYVAGVTAPQWGMPMSGTPIGLPGPPHIPLGGPAGLQRHTMRNYTPVHMPQPNRQVAIHVRQQPGYSYPKPPSRVFVREQNIYPALPFKQPLRDMHQAVDGQPAGCQPASCPQPY
jgi:hypothetical protein